MDVVVEINPYPYVELNGHAEHVGLVDTGAGVTEEDDLEVRGHLVGVGEDGRLAVGFCVLVAVCAKGVGAGGGKGGEGHSGSKRSKNCVISH